MSGYLALFLMIFLSIVGVFSLFGMLAAWLWHSEDTITLVPLGRNTTDLYTRLRWHTGPVILLELDPDEVTRAAAVRLEKEFPNVVLLRPEALTAYLTKEVSEADETTGI